MNEYIEWLKKVAPKGYKSKHSKNENKNKIKKTLQFWKVGT